MMNKYQCMILLGMSLLVCTVVGCQSTQSADPPVTNAELLKAIQEMQEEVRMLRGDVQAMAPTQPNLVEREIARLREKKNKLNRELEEMHHVRLMKDNHPSVITVQREIAILDTWIERYKTIATRQLEPSIIKLLLEKAHLEIELDRNIKVMSYSDRHPVVVTLIRKIMLLDQKIQKQIELEK